MIDANSTNQLSTLRQEACNQIENSLRPGQQQMAQWQGGELTKPNQLCSKQKNNGG